MNIHRFDETNGKVDLHDISAEAPKNITREEADKKVKELGEELFELQDLLWGARTHSVLVVLQGRDSAGKDGSIKNVVGYLNPRGVNVVSFGVPTREEQEHDFLWRVHKHAPRKGEFSIFNRSHYEDILVVRVHGLAPESIWKERFGHIHDFEELLSEHNTIILKYFLHITKDEQEKRLLEREKDPRKAWKLNPNDWKERDHWADYTNAYEEAISRTAHKRAPWIVVPANSKWYRDLVIAKSLVETLQQYKKEWQNKLDQIGTEARQELDTYRASREQKTKSK